jgi:hypothetical protein
MKWRGMKEIGGLEIGDKFENIAGEWEESN